MSLLYLVLLAFMLNSSTDLASILWPLETQMPKGPSLRLITRQEWGAREPKVIPEPMPNSPAEYAFVHHTVMPGNCYTEKTCMAAVRAIQSYHMDFNGWNDIGYSFLIGGDGRVYQGRGWNIVGAHTRDWNKQGYGFAFIGDFANKLPSQEMLAQLKMLFTEGSSRQQWLKKCFILRGHRDMVKNTTCPGEELYNFITTLDEYNRTPSPHVTK